MNIEHISLNLMGRDAERLVLRQFLEVVRDAVEFYLLQGLISCEAL